MPPQHITIDPRDLGGVAEIAEVAGVLPSAVVNWTHRHNDFPRSLVILRCGSVWDMRQVRRWLRKHPVGRSTVQKRLTREQHEHIYLRVANGEKVRKLAIEYGVSRAAIYYILRRYEQA